MNCMMGSYPFPKQEKPALTIVSAGFFNHGSIWTLSLQGRVHSVTRARVGVNFNACYSVMIRRVRKPIPEPSVRRPVLRILSA